MSMKKIKTIEIDSNNTKISHTTQQKNIMGKIETLKISNFNDLATAHA